MIVKLYLAGTRFSHQCCQFPRSDEAGYIIEKLSLTSRDGNCVVYMLPREDVGHLWLRRKSLLSLLFLHLRNDLFLTTRRTGGLTLLLVAGMIILISHWLRTAFEKNHRLLRSAACVEFGEEQQPRDEENTKGDDNTKILDQWDSWLESLRVSSDLGLTLQRFL